MIALLKYGSGTPFYWLEQLESQLGIPLPAATQWEIIEEAAELIKPARDELIRKAAQGEVVHNDDTGMRVLRPAREPNDERTGVFASGIVSTDPAWKIALFFTGGKHAGENIADVLKRRAAELPAPIQMCDALSRNVPRFGKETSPSGVEILLANGLAHGRRQFVEVAANFPEECRYVLEMLGQVYGHDAEARERDLTPDQRLRLHQDRSSPVMGQLHGWLERQFDERKTEPNSGLGKAITYLLRHGRPLTPDTEAEKNVPGRLVCRVYTNDQQTIPLQIRALREYAARRGWTIAMQGKEVGAGASQRQLREKLLEAARRREIDGVLV